MRLPMFCGATGTFIKKHIRFIWTEAILALLLTVNWATSKNPKDDFCRRFAHQTTVIDDKLYIDGGWVDFDDFQQTHENYSNTWLAYHDLNNLVKRGGDLWPDLNISLSKNESIPSVNGGILWGDSVNKRFYLYGGEWNNGFSQEPYSLLSYDIIYDKWDDFGTPDITPPPKIASYGAGVGVSETGIGYYLGGWISNASMSGWTDDRTMSSNFYTYSYDSEKFTQAASLSKQPRAEGGMVWIPAGDSLGLLVYLGGIVDPFGNNTEAPQAFDEVFVFDAKGNSWSTQKTTGEIPQNRRQFCVDVAWAPDKSSFNIYLWGGLSVQPPVVNATSFNDIYILTLPSFIWVKAYPHHHGNATLPPEYDHYSASCNMVKHMSQLFRMMLAIYNPNITENVVPADVYNVTGGNKKGGAKLAAPKDGFDEGNKPLQDLLGRRPEIAERSPTRSIHSTTGTSTASPKPTETSNPDSKLSTGAIVGIAIGGAAGVALLLFVWFCVGKKINRRREERRQSSMTQNQYQGNGGNLIHPPSTVSPLAATGYWGHGSEPVSPHHMSPHQSISVSQGPPTELPAEQHGDVHGVSELPQDAVGRKTPASPGVSSQSWSPGPPSSYTPDRRN
ncbi:Lignostilbene-alpha,beta-dioxygenase isozyme III [Fusarium oxysporum f. sp. albedinis]|nr:Lignostilbene-alpha,beta-dioxygenase isozyme III [Fusarium oxysporum f. sp. albedinis]